MSDGTGRIAGRAAGMADTALEDRGEEVPGRRRWLILAVVALAQLMVVLDATIVNIALPSAQRALHFSNTDRQWVITAYALAFGSLLLLGGRLADLLGRKAMFLAGLAGFAVASAVGGAATNFAMLVTARACQGAFGALLAPAALSLLTTTFTGSRDRGKAFGVFGAIAGAGGGIGLLVGGLLTQYASWRACLEVNLVFAAIAGTGAVLLLRQQQDRQQHGLDLPGVLAEGGATFCIVYGFSNAATHSWQSPDTWGFLAAGSAGQVGGSIGTSLLNSVAASATAAYLTASSLHATAGGRPTQALTELAQVHGYTTAFWWAAGIFAGGAVTAGLLFRSGPPPRPTAPATARKHTSLRHHGYPAAAATSHQ